MLVLTRKPGEAIHIGDGIVITVVEVDAKTCRIGIQAPASVPVYREEVYKRIQEENLRAAAAARPDLQAMADLFRRKD
ncbi:MAG TPA: carbon storage regulator CsrA [Fibrobacteria bacterium]|nr:carbon storage regulator CsrA [Fibrobacteria bacterium]HOX53135.1 carbon storage regulator CsrA [Fibrobacteria bacterium]